MGYRHSRVSFAEPATPGRGTKIDKKQQATRIQRIVNTIAERAAAVSDGARPAYIQEEVASVREAFRRTYEADESSAAYAMEFVDTMDRWIKTRVHALETERSRVELVRDRAELNS
jgi:hypothetical protein